MMPYQSYQVYQAERTKTAAEIRRADEQPATWPKTCHDCGSTPPGPSPCSGARPAPGVLRPA